MCLYPRLMMNPKYRANKKNGGVIPPCFDGRVKYVPIGCGVCIECRQQKARNWQVRLLEDIKDNTNGRFVTLTFSTESLKKLIEQDKTLAEKQAKVDTETGELLIRKNLGDLKGYDLDNGIVTVAVRYFLERWRKEHKKSLRHWLISELGGGHTEHVHLHGIVWTDKIEDIEKHWKYGYVWAGYKQIDGSTMNYVTEKTVNYITKYVTKVDPLHKAYEPVVLCSPGIGSNYVKSRNFKLNKYDGEQTSEAYITRSGSKIALPIYWRNKVYTEEQREKLWIQKLDKQERWVCGERIDISGGEEDYNKAVEYHRRRTSALGYRSPEFIWKRAVYENARRAMIQEKRFGSQGQ